MEYDNIEDCVRNLADLDEEFKLLDVRNIFFVFNYSRAMHIFHIYIIHFFVGIK